MPNEWQPITDYEPGEPEALANGELRALAGVWIEQKSRLEESGSMTRFTERLRREWAIETGLIERLYTLDRGITASLIEHGVKATLIPHNGSNNPEYVVTLIRDQEAALESVFSFVKGERELSTSYIKELHQLFTRHQDHVEGVDQFERRTHTPLIRGAYKKQPNNPTRPDGEIHYYCPPVHVDKEMERLLEMHHGHRDSAPEVEAAWLHHRFTHIHPFQDGNGRLARALATLIFIKAGWLPLVVRNDDPEKHIDDREKYISALESADEGDLQPLVSLFSEFQRREFIKAIGIARDVEQSERVDAQIEAIGQRLAQRRDSLEREWSTAMASAEKLREIARHRMQEICSSLTGTLEDHGVFELFVDEEGDEGARSHYHHAQIISTAKHLGYFANTRGYRSWVRLVIEDRNASTQSDLLISFHGLGQQFKGVLACSATWFQRVPGDDENLNARETGGETPLCDEVFQINYKEDADEIGQRFLVWLERAMGRGLAIWEQTSSI